MQRKTLLYLVLGVCAFTAIYLYYVDVDRKRSIEKYFPQPKPGDVYKIKADDDEGETWMTYYKIVEVSEERLVFITSKLMGGSSSDMFLNHYDTSNTVIFTKKELTEIKNGQWKTFLKNNTDLVEIVRRN